MRLECVASETKGALGRCGVANAAAVERRTATTENVASTDAEADVERPLSKGRHQHGLERVRSSNFRSRAARIPKGGRCVTSTRCSRGIASRRARSAVSSGSGGAVYDKEYSLREFGGILRMYAGWGMWVVFAPEDEVHEEPVIQVRKPKRDR
jgi:hypothetical protein